MDDTRAILVLGMHRSGTSVLTAGLEKVLGIKLGKVSYYSSKENPKGFYEISEVVSLNNKILQSMGSSWDGLSLDTSCKSWEAALKMYRQEALELLSKYFCGQKQWALKDPRITILLPFWEEVLRRFGAIPYRIIALRHPMEIALSQKIRQEDTPGFYLCGSDLRYTFNLWYWYNLRLLNSLSDDNNIVVEFDRFLSDPADEFVRIGKKLDIQPNRKPLEDYKINFLDKQLKHHNIQDIQINPYLREYGYVFELYTRMKSYASKDCLASKDIVSLLSGLPDEQILQSWTVPFYGYIGTIKEKISTLNEQCNTLKQVNDKMQKQIVSDTSQLCQMQDAALKSNRQISQFENSIKEINLKNSDLNEQCKTLKQVNDKMQKQIVSDTLQLCQMQDAVLKSNRQISQFENSIKEINLKNSDLQNKLAEAESQIQHLHNTINQQNTLVAGKERAISELKNHLVSKDSLIALSNTKLTNRDRRICRYQEELYSVYTSRSWRYTLPLRKIGDMLRWLRRVPHQPLIRRYIKGAYLLLPVSIRRIQWIEKWKKRFQNIYLG